MYSGQRATSVVVDRVMASVANWREEVAFSRDEFVNEIAERKYRNIPVTGIYERMPVDVAR